MDEVVNFDNAETFIDRIDTCLIKSIIHPTVCVSQIIEIDTGLRPTAQPYGNHQSYQNPNRNQLSKVWKRCQVPFLSFHRTSHICWAIATTASTINITSDWNTS